MTPLLERVGLPLADIVYHRYYSPRPHLLTMRSDSAAAAKPLRANPGTSRNIVQCIIRAAACLQRGWSTPTIVGS